MMRNSIAAGRRIATRLVLTQGAVALLLALLFSVSSLSAAMGAFAGSSLIMLGTALLAARAFAPDTRRGGTALTRMVAGLLLKWVIVLGGLFLLLVHWRLPPGPVVIGLVAALLVNLMALRFNN
ncbi:MAG: ATP synthase subunit I [Dokdonella sp.]